MHLLVHTGIQNGCILEWLPGNPSNSWHHEDCVHLQLHLDQGYFWNDVNCDALMAFVCQKRYNIKYMLETRAFLVWF